MSKCRRYDRSRKEKEKEKRLARSNAYTHNTQLGKYTTIET